MKEAVQVPADVSGHVKGDQQVKVRRKDPYEGGEEKKGHQEHTKRENPRDTEGNQPRQESGLVRIAMSAQGLICTS